MILSTSASTALLALLVYIQDNTVKGGRGVNESLGQAELGFNPIPTIYQLYGLGQVI